MADFETYHNAAVSVNGGDWSETQQVTVTRPGKRQGVETLAGRRGTKFSGDPLAADISLTVTQRQYLEFDLEAAVALGRKDQLRIDKKTGESPKTYLGQWSPGDDTHQTGTVDTATWTFTAVLVTKTGTDL